MRSTGLGNEGAWIAVVTCRYKLILSKSDTQWLIDMETDPNGKINFFKETDKSEVVKNLVKKLSNYAIKHNDQYLQGNKMADDLKFLLN